MEWSGILKGLIAGFKVIVASVALVGAIYIGLIIITLILGVVASVAGQIPGIPTATNTTIQNLVTEFNEAVTSLSGTALIVISLVAVAVIVVVFKPWVQTKDTEGKMNY